MAAFVGAWIIYEMISRIISAVVRIPESGYSPYFFSRQDIDYCLENTLDYADYQFLSSESTVETRFKVVIPKED